MQYICKDGKSDAHKKDSSIKIEGAKTKTEKKSKESIGEILRKMVNESENVSCIPIEEDGTLSLTLNSFASGMQVDLSHPIAEAEALKNTLPGLVALLDSGADLNSVKDYIDKNGLKADSIC